MSHEAEIKDEFLTGSEKYLKKENETLKEINFANQLYDSEYLDITASQIRDEFKKLNFSLDECLNALDRAKINFELLRNAKVPLGMYPFRDCFFFEKKTVICAKGPYRTYMTDRNKLKNLELIQVKSINSLE